MKTTQSKAARLGAAKHYTRPHSKRFPAFGKRLMEQRMSGQVPRNSVVVTFDWEIGRAFPCVVIADAVPFDNLELRFLAGLDVIIAYRDKDASRVHELAQAILAVNPRLLQTFAMDIPKTTILKNSDGECLL